METNDFFTPVRFDAHIITTADMTRAGDFDKWASEIYTSDGHNNDSPTENAVIFSPFHRLTVNETEIPVYTARCGLGTHSFAQIEIDAVTEEFSLFCKLKLSDIHAGKCQILPVRSNIKAEISAENEFTAIIDKYGSFTFTFAEKADDEVTDAKTAPLTLFVKKKIPLDIPTGYSLIEIKPGHHRSDELMFEKEYSVYLFKKGFHDITSISIPSHSILYIETGAYLYVTDREENGEWNSHSAIECYDGTDVEIICSGLLDTGALVGGEHKHKHVLTFSRCKDITVYGTTVVNSNTWTMCFYNCENAVAEYNMLLSYRTYSDGIMMSECRRCIGRYNFVRTGDDAIEFKGTGWHGENTGCDCVYEYNDVWTDKGAGYCLTWENNCPMHDMVFRHNNIGFALPTWTDRNTALDCLVGINRNIRWGDITFTDTEIYCVISPNAINCQVTSDGAILENILFENINVLHALPYVHAYRMLFTADGGDVRDVRIKNMTFNGRKITKEDTKDKNLFCNEAGEKFSTLIAE